MSKPRHPGRYVVYHSAFGEKPCDTLKEAREFVRFVERQTSYAPCIYDTLKECNVYVY